MVSGCNMKLDSFTSGLKENQRKFVVVTDLEPDDRVGLNILAHYLDNHELGLVGTTLLNSERKRVLTERTLQDLGLFDIPTYRGTGGRSSDYINIASSRLARNYMDEGKGILSSKELLSLQGAPRDGNDFQQALIRYLEENSDVEILVMTAPTDIVAVLGENGLRPDLISKVKYFHVMGGWDTELRTTFNWNMGRNIQEFLNLGRKIPMRVFSSHAIKDFFQGGSISRKNMPELTKLIEYAKIRLRSLRDLEIAGRSWDSGLVKEIPDLAERIGLDNLGRQFTPADVLLIMSIFREDELIQREIPLEVQITQDLDLGKGYLVKASLSPNSMITIVESIDVNFFNAEMKRIFTFLPQTVDRRLKKYHLKKVLRSLKEVSQVINKFKGNSCQVTNITQNYIAMESSLQTQSSEFDYFLLDPTERNAIDFARIARNSGFKVYAIVNESKYSLVDNFSHFDDVLVVSDSLGSDIVLENLGKSRLTWALGNGGIDKVNEVYISFHTRDQSLAEIDKLLQLISPKHPNSTLIHNFLPESQLHYLVPELREHAKSTLGLLQTHFPNLISSREHFVGLKNTRSSAAQRAGRNQSQVYVLGSISAGVGKEIIEYLSNGADVSHLELGSSDLSSINEISFSSKILSEHLSGMTGLVVSCNELFTKILEYKNP